jgi:hypothetical protein
LARDIDDEQDGKAEMGGEVGSRTSPARGFDPIEQAHDALDDEHVCARSCLGH